MTRSQRAKRNETILHFVTGLGMGLVISCALFIPLLLDLSI